MAYQENKPEATEQFNISQSDIQNNFQSNKVAFDQNHVTFDDVDAGKHKFIQMPEQSAAPTTGVNEMALYSKEEDGTAQLFLRRESDGTELNLTNDALKNSDGWLRLPSGILIKWGIKASITREVLTTVTFPVGASIPVFTALYNVLANQSFTAGPTEANLNVAFLTGNFTTTTFQLFPRNIGSTGSGTVFAAWVAIGV